MSGGIDSLVAAHLLKKEGHEIFGIHFKTGFEKNKIDFSSIQDKFDIEIHTVDLSQEFNRSVVNYFLDTYTDGKTPNPCILCNKTIKFGALLDAAELFGAKKIATGHYVRTRNGENGIYLIKGMDHDKDQSYFLSMLSQEQLKKALFPLGEMTKAMVRKIAEQNNLVPIEKKESQDICFINGPSFSDFIVSRLNITPIPGDIVLSDNRVIGRHRGLHCYTLGQRRGLNCPGPEPYYVKKIDILTNTLTLGVKKELYTKEVVLTNLNWMTAPFTSKEKVVTKIRYSHKGASSELIQKNSLITLLFDEPQFAVTPGQIAVFYQKEQVLGSGIIK